MKQKFDYFSTPPQTKIRVERRPSIFNSRRGKEDCIIITFYPTGHPQAWGWRVAGGYEHTAVRIACETGEIIRYYEGTMPDKEELKRQGFID